MMHLAMRLGLQMLVPDNEFNLTGSRRDENDQKRRSRIWMRCVVLYNEFDTHY